MTAQNRQSVQPPDIWQILTVAPPLIAAFGAVPLGLFWVMGASAFSGSDKSWVFNLGFWTILGYVFAYSVLMLFVGVSSAFKWRIVSLFQALIWLSFLIFVGIIVWTFSVLAS